MLPIDPFYFFVAFGVGIMIVYISTPPPEIVLKFPSPYNAGQVLYRDKANSCYRYKAEDVACPRDKSKIRPQPILEDFVQKNLPQY